MKFTEASVARLHLPAGKPDAIFFDDQQRCFGLRLRSSGKKSWVVQYRFAGLTRRMLLGDYGELSLKAAKAAARQALAKVRLGTDPQAEKKKKNAKATDKFEDVAARYLEFAKTKLKPRSYQEVERHIKKQWRPLNRLSIRTIDRAVISQRLDAMEKESGPVAANRARASLSGFFSWAMRRGAADTNPVVGTNKAIENPSRDRVLSDTELVEIWNACGDDDYGRIVRLLILTGQRREEIGGICESEISLPDRVWNLPRERTKNKRPHAVPLSDAAIDLLNQAPPHAGRDWLFGSGAVRSFQGWSRAKTNLDHAIWRIRRARPSEWRLHDIRRTVATRMINLGVLPHIVESVQNRISGHLAGPAGIYNRAEYISEKRDALAKWGEYVTALVGKKDAKVVALHGTGRQKMKA